MAEKQGEAKHDHEGTGKVFASILHPASLAKAKEFPFGPMMTKRFICAEVLEVLDGTTPPATVSAALIGVGGPIPIDPTPENDPAGLPSTKGTKVGTIYKWITDPTAQNNPGELIRTTVPNNNTGTFWFVVWFRNSTATYYIETRKVTIRHNPADNNCDPH